MADLLTADGLGSLTTEEAAIVAASQASEAVTELLLFAREGAACERFTFEGEPVSRLAEALLLTIDLHDIGPNHHLDEDELSLLRKLREAAASYIAGWVG